MNFCTKCGAALEPGAFFCTSCGAPIDGQPAGGPAKVPEQPKAHKQIEYPADNHKVDPQPKAAFHQTAPAFTPASSGSGVSIFDVYKKALAVLFKKPVRLWGISLLSGLLTFILELLFGFAIGIGICIGILINVGMTMVYLHGYRGEQVRAVQLFDAFKDGATIKRVLGGIAWKKLWVFLWFLIPIAGPFIAIYRSYQYSLTPYILIMEPEVKATEAMELSKERTNGWKLRMFGADILVYACIFVVVLVLTLLAKIPVLGVLFSIIMFVFNILVALLRKLFNGLVDAAFYEEIRKSL